MKKLLLLIGLVVFLVPSLVNGESLLDNLFKKGQDLFSRAKGEIIITCPNNFSGLQAFKINSKKKTIYEDIGEGSKYQWAQLYGWYDYEGDWVKGKNATFTRKKDGTVIVSKNGRHVATWIPNKSEPMFFEN